MLLLVLALGTLPLVAQPTLADESAELAEGPVETGADTVDDREIEIRLRELFASIPTLNDVDVSVHAGVVSLDGTVTSASAAETAVALAKRVDGVVAVQDRLDADRSVETQMERALERFEARGETIVGWLPVFAIALLAFLTISIAARAVARLEAPFRWLTPNPFLRDLARQIVRVTGLLVGLWIALEVVDATSAIGALLGAAGVVSVTLGFAFRDLVENYIASILLSLRQPFLPTDWVRIGDYEGHVARLTSRATILLTAEGNHLRIPNAQVFKGVVENFSRKPERRLDFAVGIGVDEDLAAAQDLGVLTLRGMSGVLAVPEPIALIEALGDSSVVVRFIAWVDQRSVDFLKARSEAIRLVKRALDEAGVEMPEPIQRIHLRSGSELPVREEASERSAAAKATADARDITPERHLQAELEAERETAAEDLLDEDARTE